MNDDDLIAQGKAVSERLTATRNSHVLEDVPLPPEPDWSDDPTEMSAPETGAATSEPDDPGVDVDWRERSIEIELDKLRIRGEARRRFDNETRPPIHYPPIRSLTAMLDEPDTPTRYRIQGVAPVDARIMCSAQYKAGKTTLISNMIRALVDAEPFLGRFTVNTPAHGVVLIDDEMSENTLRSWLRAQDIRNAGAVADVITLRGNVGAFNLLDAQCLAAWVQRLADVGCDYLILDCLRPILDALGLDENHDAGRFLVAFDALLNQAGIGDALLVQHMGHTGERARGDSRMQDWPDAIWRLVREDDDPASARWFTAYGRDVDVTEGRLSFDPATRRLTYSAGSRGDARSEAAQLAVITLLAGIAKDGGEPPSYRGLEELLIDEHTQKAIRAGIALAVKHGLVKVTIGPRRAKLHAIAYPCGLCGMPVASQQDRHLDCPSTPQDLFT